MITPEDVVKKTLPNKPNPLHDFLEVARKENGFRLLIEAYYETRTALLEVLQNAYLKDNRNGAVQAGILRGFRLAFEEIPRAVLRQIEEEEERKKEAKKEEETPYEGDTGY